MKRFMSFFVLIAANPGNGHDIGLVELATPLTFSPSIQPICFPTSDNVLGTVISACDQKAYGWGRTDPAGTPANILQKLDVTVLPDVNPCSNLTDERIICSRGDAPSSGICLVRFLPSVNTIFPESEFFLTRKSIISERRPSHRSCHTQVLFIIFYKADLQEHMISEELFL